MVEGSGFERRPDAARNDVEAEKKSHPIARSDASVHDGPPSEPEVGQVDGVESALADALTKAATAGRFEVVETLGKELQARRKARSEVVDLEAARARRAAKS